MDTITQTPADLAGSIAGLIVAAMTAILMLWLISLLGPSEWGHYTSIYRLARLPGYRRYYAGRHRAEDRVTCGNWPQTLVPATGG